MNFQTIEKMGYLLVFATLILLKAVDELSYREIGDLLGESENQVRGKLYRARKAFRDALAARTLIGEPKP